MGKTKYIQQTVNRGYFWGGDWKKMKEDFYNLV